MKQKSPMVYNGISKIPKKFHCQTCDYNTSNRKDFIKHCGTTKHGIKWYIPTKTDCKYFQCKDCDYISGNLEHMKDHFSRFNHSEKSLGRGFFDKSTSIPKVKKQEKKVEKSNENNEKKIICEICGKGYKYQSGYYRHKKTCTPVKKINKNDLTSQNDKLIKLLVESTENNNKLCEKMLQMENNQKIILTNNTINNNQKLNINVFLNEDCKNAMNLSDFVNKIQLTLDDLNYTMNNGFVKGITNIFVKNLEEMEVTSRPIHSVPDNKKTQFYIKDHDTWKCDKKEQKLDNTIDSVSKKQIHQIKQWESTHPEWNKTEEGMEDYMKMVQTIMGGINENERQINRNQIKKELTESVGVEVNEI